MPPFDLVIKNALVVSADRDVPDRNDIAVTDGRIALVGPDIPVEGVATVIDGRGRYAFPTLNHRLLHRVRTVGTV